MGGAEDSLPENLRLLRFSPCAKPQTNKIRRGRGVEKKQGRRLSVGVKASEVRKFQSPQPAGWSTREGDGTGCLLGTVLPYGGTNVIQDPR